MRGESQEAVISNINPIVRGWCQYYTSVVSNKTFHSMDMIMYTQLWRWAKFKHPNKGGHWIKRKYFKKYGNDNWRFMTSNEIHIRKHGDHVIRRHIKVKGTRSPYDGLAIQSFKYNSRKIATSNKITEDTARQM
ncbi:group II intron-encoded protein ltrA [Nephila pilipes]|uniref:Group II intron-encoded protein ltrA n=1 Tax=Nephila pilipes TaxID=299642 RepID=A0A8X6U6I3_NEPPI|nr:group II intron-encoded protein ltrA [Nephila pilipes]